MLPAFFLVCALAALGWFMKEDRGEYRRFAALTDTALRQRRYRAWIAKAWIAFVVPPMVGLALLGRFDELWRVPSEFAPAIGSLPALAHGGGSELLLIGLLLGSAIGVAVVGIATAIRRRQGRVELPTIGDFSALLPRNAGEARWALGLAITAGVTEEVAFRLFLPLLLTLVTGHAVLSFGSSAVLFGLMHLYQGWKGVIATGVVGLVMTVLYLGSGALWLAIVAHAVIDVMALVVRPAISGALRQP